jgi:hypothetical protein
LGAAVAVEELAFELGWIRRLRNFISDVVLRRISGVVEKEVCVLV